GRGSGVQCELQVDAMTVAKDVIGNPVADLVVEAHECLKLPGGHLQRLVVRSQNDVVGADARLPGGVGKKRALIEDELFFIQSECAFFLGAEILALDPGYRLQTSQRPTPGNVGLTPPGSEIDSCRHEMTVAPPRPGDGSFR